MGRTSGHGPDDQGTGPDGAPEEGRSHGRTVPTPRPRRSPEGVTPRPGLRCVVSLITV